MQRFISTKQALLLAVMLVIICLLLRSIFDARLDGKSLESYSDLSSLSNRFEVIIDAADSPVRNVDLNDFFTFIEYFMVTDHSDPYDQFGEKGAPFGFAAGEHIGITNSIRELLRSLYYIVHVNNKDNFYSRFLVSSIASNLEYAVGHQRRANWDEIVRDRIGMPLKPEERDQTLANYYPKPSYRSYHQNPMPTSRNIHNYYTGENTMVSLRALQKMIDLVQANDITLFSDIIRPTEYVAFEHEFVYPLRVIVKEMLNIISTDMYRRYLHEQRFELKYRGIVFNPYMVEL